MFPHYIAYNFLFADLLRRYVYIQDLPYFLFPILTPVLIFLISKNFLKGIASYIPAIIFIISPWFWYLVDTQSLYVLIFFLTLVATYGVILTIKGRHILGNTYLTLAGFMLIYASSLFLILIPVFLAVLIFTRTIKLKYIKISIVILFVLSSPLFFMVAKNKSLVESRLVNEIKIFTDPALINSVNHYQGAATQDGFKILARISENKYIFIIEYSALKYMEQLIPESYLTPQYKLLGFSNSPPLFVGFIFPLAYGLYKLLSSPKARKYIFVSTILVVPSMLGNSMVSINRLILFSPVLIIIITYGLIYLYNNSTKGTSAGTKTAKIFLAITVFLVLSQLVLTIVDIKTREPIRSKMYFGSKYVQQEQ